jgi:hypothetical protein
MSKPQRFQVGQLETAHCFGGIAKELLPLSP